MTGPAALRTYSPEDGIQPLGDLWTLWRRGLRLRCDLSTHPLGWELRLEQANALIRTQVSKTQTEVFDTSDNWRIKAIGSGWQAIT